jgi:uncharacterized protein with NAD-binding domain and iron-sulfur cluster
VDISDWDTPSSRLGKPARECTEAEILDEVWEQLADHLEQGEIAEENLLLRFLDPAIDFRDPANLANDEPLLINTKRSWRHRPDAVTRIPNLVIASDFVRSNTDLATMEGANEAARRAVNGILDQEGFDAEDRCAVFDLDEPALLKPLRVADAIAWRMGRRGPRRSPFTVNEAGELTGRDPISSAVALSLRLASKVLPG